MVTIRIGGDSRNLHEGDENWITQQVNSRKREGLSVCVEIRVEAGGLNLRLTTPGCGAGAAGGRPPTQDEARIFELWNKHRLGTDEFSGGNLVAFVKQLSHLL